MDGNNKVSIIIPVYNGSKYLRKAIDSALGQTYPNLEVIVVNDGSRDNGATEQIALSYGEQIRYYVKENGGVSSALNLGINKMTGEYFSWLSHDDVYYPQKIAVQMKYLKENNLIDTIVYGGYELIDESSNPIGQILPENIYLDEKLSVSLFPVLRGLINGCSLLIHKSHFERTGLFDEQLVLVQDYDLWFKMFREAQVKCLSGIFVKTRIHKEQQSTENAELNLKECNELWIWMVDKVNVKEMCAMDGSPYAFYHNTADFLRRFTKYTEAQKYVEALARKTKGKISVIIPFHNRISYLLEAISSVLSQSYKNIEVLLIDDGSTEDLGELKVIRDPRIRYVYQKQQGVSAARNLGISLATGEYIAFLDSDDLFIPKKLEKQFEYMERHSLSFSHTSYQRMNMQGIPKEIISSGRFAGNVFPRIIASCGIATSTVMIKREILNKQQFDETVEFGEDVCLWIDIAYRIPIGGIDEPLAMIRVGRTSSAFNTEKQQAAYKSIYDHVIKNPYYRSHKQEIQCLLTDYFNIQKNDANWSKNINKHIHR